MSRWKHKVFVRPRWIRGHHEWKVNAGIWKRMDEAGEGSQAGPPRGRGSFASRKLKLPSSRLCLEKCLILWANVALSSVRSSQFPCQSQSESSSCERSIKVYLA
jgi:hypothetical protein